MTYRIEIRPAALRALKQIDRIDQPRIHGVIALLAEDPRPPSSRQLKGRPGYRVRVGDYRIIYTIDDGVLVIFDSAKRRMVSTREGRQRPQRIV